MDMKTLYSQLNTAITRYNLATRRGNDLALALAWGMPLSISRRRWAPRS